jgi:hypothetical protein
MKFCKCPKTFEQYSTIVCIVLNTSLFLFLFVDDDDDWCSGSKKEYPLVLMEMVDMHLVLSGKNVHHSDCHQ